MVSGTYVLTDTIKAGFNTIFTESYKNVDAVVSGKRLFGSQDQTKAPTFPESLLGKVQSLPGVAEVSGGVENDPTQLVGHNGKAIVNGGAPNLGFSINPASSFNQLSLVSGSWPNGPGEVAIDKGTADKKHYGVGQTIGVAARGPVRKFRIVGIAELGGVASIGGATLAVFDLPTA